MADLQELKDVKDAEVVEEKALAPIDAGFAMVKEADKPIFALMSKADSLDWRALPPNQMALLLTQKPFPAPGGGTSYLNLRQALLFALRAYELGVSPLSSEVWFDPNRGTTNLTLEGKKQVARNRGIDLGPPQFEDLSREWNELPKSNETAEELKKLGYPRDLGVRCRVRVGKPEHQEYSTYTCWLSEWFVGRSPVWKAKTAHMMQTRAYEKCISLAMGTGASDAVDE